MSELTIWALALKTAPIWYGVVKGFLSERVAEAGKDLVEEGIQEGAKSGIIAAVDRLRDPEGKSFSEAFEKASKSFLARYELDRDLAGAVIRILNHAREKQLHELNRDVLISTIFSDKPRVAPIERYCQRVIAFDQIIAGSVKTYSITEVSRAFRYFFEELQRELMLSERWRDVVVQFRSLQLQAKIAGEFDPLEMRREYLAYLRDRYQFLDLKGFSPRVSGQIISLRLTGVFTDLQLEEGRPYVSKYAEDDLAMMTEKQFFELDWQRQLDLLEKRYVRLEATKPKVQLLRLYDVLTSRRVVILGDPGSGKTTLTRYLTLAMASNDYSRTGRVVEGLLPVLVRVANYGRALQKDPTLHLVDYICHELTSDFGPVLKQELEYGQCLVMLDGLDEVVEVGQRQRVAESIEDMVATYGKNRFLVTSRPIGYQSVQLAADFRHVALRPLTEKEQEQFVRLWHKEIRTRGAGKAEGVGWFEEPEALIKALETKPSVAKLASNPLLLTIIVLMYWRGTKLPDRRVDIYASATETLIENWPLRQRGIDLDLEQVKSILAPVALAVLSSSVSVVITERNLVPLLLEIVQEVHGGTRAAAQAICDNMLRDLSEHSGIFLERGRDEYDYPVYGFLHQTFGEYLAAVALAELWNVGELKLSDYVHKARWREVILLLAGVIGTQGRAVASRFVSEILALSSPFAEILHRDLLLVLECLGDDLRIKPTLRKEILKRGVELLGNEVFELRSDALDRIKRLKGTDHAATAVELLKELLEKAKGQPKGVRRDETRLAAAEALCELGDPEFAKPIIWEISEDVKTFGNIVGQLQGAVTKLRVLYWTRESLEWLANLFRAERWTRPRLLLGKSVSETFIRTADGTDIPIFDHLKDDELAALFDMLCECVSEEDVRQRVEWARIQRQSSMDVDKLLELADSQIDRQVCFLAASQLIDMGYAQAGIDALQRLCGNVDHQAFTAAQRLSDLGESISALRAIRELAIFLDSLDGVQLARKLAEIGEKSLGVAILLLHIAKEAFPIVQWEATESLLELGMADLGLAAAKCIASTPGHPSRYEATEALLDAQREIGRFEEVIEILVDLAYDSYGLDQEKAIARLATLRDTEQIAPLLSRASRSSDATSQYRVACALVLGGMSAIPGGGSIDAILARRIQRLPEKNRAFLQCRSSFLKLALDYIDDQLANHDIDGLIHGIKAVLLHESGEYSKAEELLRHVGDSCEHHGDVTLFVARTWRDWGCPDRAFAVATKVLTDSEASLTAKKYATGLVGKMLLESTNEVLLQVVTSSDNSSVQISAIKNLRNPTNPEVVLALQGILQTNPHDYRIRESIVEQLGEVAIPESKEMLLKALNDDAGSVRAAAANALNTLGSEEFLADLVNALRDPDERVRLAAIQAIDAVGCPVTADALGQALLHDTSAEVQRNVASALSLAKPDEAKPYLLEALAGKINHVRYAALQSIQELEEANAIPLY
jgi:HEAT repeat protein